MDIYRLENTVQEYGWGSPAYIPKLTGTPNPDGRPKAEIWMGSHPKAPSMAVGTDETLPLPELISRDPDSLLGRRVAAANGEKLPFLFKVLAAGTALSIQSHPNLKQARKGFRRENRMGIPPDAPNRNYRDDNHKPEIICALTPFWAMCGFRPVDQIVENLSALDTDVLAGSLGGLRVKRSRKGLQRLFHDLMKLGDEPRKALVDAACRKAGQSPVDDIGRWVTRLNELFPGDIGVVCPLLLNVYQLNPGEAIYLGAGELHAYLEGLGIELMANSDNVLRGGLTPKHVDVKELQRTLTFASGVVPVLVGRETSPTETVYDAPVDEFALSRITIDDGHRYTAPKDRNVEILIVTDGECTIRQKGADDLVLRKGESALVPASAGRYEIAGAGILFKATVP